MNPETWPTSQRRCQPGLLPHVFQPHPFSARPPDQPPVSVWSTKRPKLFAGRSAFMRLHPGSSASTIESKFSMSFFPDSRLCTPTHDEVWNGRDAWEHPTLLLLPGTTECGAGQHSTPE